MISDIDKLIANGDYWTNSPPYQTNVNIFGLQTQDWINLKMSFIWSCFAYMQREAQIKSVKSWGYQTSLKTTEDRERYWHQHLREGSQVISGVYYLALPDSVCGAVSQHRVLKLHLTVLMATVESIYAPWKCA